MGKGYEDWTEDPGIVDLAVLAPSVGASEKEYPRLR
jgi:hypothetical protein